MTNIEFIDAIRAHALANYSNGGWDVVAEAWSADDILEYFEENDYNYTKAFKALSRFVKAYNDYGNDIRNA